MNMQTVERFFTSDSIEPVKVAARYKMALVVVAIAMVLLPLVYLSIVGVTAYGVYLHATVNRSIMEGSGATLWRAIGYFAPLIAGGILLLFMAKPLFSRPARTDDPVEIDPERAPELFAFVRRIVNLVGAPEPHRVVVDCQANASASFSDGLVAFLRRDLTLTIGLPLVTSLSIQQFGGVLAHEFGHFAQGAGMRLSYLIRAINHWFARVVFERDEWDERLEDWSTRLDVRLAASLLLARLFVWITRKILFGLMMIGNVLSGIMLRQMEYDADRYEARVAGRVAFETTSNRLPLVALSTQIAFGQLQQAWMNKRLADDFPALAFHQFGRIEVEASIDSPEQKKAGWTDTHPTAYERIQSVSSEDATGVLQGQDESAESLFRDFEGLSEAATLSMYRVIIDENITERNLVPTNELIEESTQYAHRHEAGKRLFGSSMDSAAAVSKFFVSDVEVDSIGAAATRIAELRKRNREIDERLDLGEEVGELHASRTTAKIARALLRGKLPFDLKDYGLDGYDREGVVRRIQELDDRLQAIGTALEPVIANASTIVGIVCRVIEADTDHVLGVNVDETSDFRQLVELANKLSPLLPKARELEESLHISEAVFGSLAGMREPTTAIISLINNLIDRMRMLIVDLREATLDDPYPFAHVEDDLTVGQFLVKKVPTIVGDGKIGETMPAAAQAMSGFLTLFFRILGRIAETCERVEESLADGDRDLRSRNRGIEESRNIGSRDQE
ncbi:MAG: M48 family metalloprotease [Rhodothermales bacterium]